MGDRCRGLLEPDIEDKAVARCDLVKQPVREAPELRVLGHVLDRVEAGSLLFPLGRVLAGSVDLELEKLALALLEPRSETSHLI